MPAINWVQALWHELAGMPNVTVLTRTTAFGYYDHNMIALLEHRGQAMPEQRAALLDALIRYQGVEVRRDDVSAFGFRAP